MQKLLNRFSQNSAERWYVGHGRKYKILVVTRSRYVRVRGRWVTVTVRWRPHDVQYTGFVGGGRDSGFVLPGVCSNGNNFAGSAAWRRYALYTEWHSSVCIFGRCLYRPTAIIGSRCDGRRRRRVEDDEDVRASVSRRHDDDDDATASRRRNHHSRPVPCRM